MKRRVPGWKADFPILETVEDFAGKQRKFLINWEFGVVDPLECTPAAHSPGATSEP